MSATVGRHRRRVPWWRRPAVFAGLFLPRRRAACRAGRARRAALAVAGVAAVGALGWTVATAGGPARPRPAVAAPAEASVPTMSVEEAVAAAPELPAVTTTSTPGRPVIVVSLPGGHRVLGQLWSQVQPGAVGQTIVLLPDFDPYPVAGQRGAVVWTAAAGGSAEQIVWTVIGGQPAAAATFAAVTDRPSVPMLTLVAGTGATRGVVNALALDRSPAR